MAFIERMARPRRRQGIRATKTRGRAAGLGILGLNNVIRGTAARHGVEVADTHGKLGAGQWVGDCLHPNDAGYATVAALVSEMIDD